MPNKIFRVLAFILAMGQASVFAIDLPEEREAQLHNNQPRVLMVKPAPQKIVVSIKPYALIFESIKREGDTVSVLIEDGASAHDFQFRPSHLRKIAEADLVIWGGEKLEPTLAKAIKNNKQLILGDIKTLDLIETQADHKGHSSSQNENQNHDHDTQRGGQIDPHIWLSQKNVQEIAKAMAEALYYPKQATQQLQAQLMMISMADRYRKTKFQENPSVLVVYHNAYAYLEKELNIQHSFVINESHNSKPSLRHRDRFNKKLLEYKAQNKNICFVTLPGFKESREEKNLKQMLANNKMQTQVNFIEIDPLASTGNYKNYFEFWRESRNNLLKCLSQ